MAGGAFLKLVRDGELLYRVMTADASDSGSGFVRKQGVGIYLGFVALVIE